MGMSTRAAVDLNTQKRKRSRKAGRNLGVFLSHNKSGVTSTPNAHPVQVCYQIDAKVEGKVDPVIDSTDLASVTSALRFVGSLDPNTDLDSHLVRLILFGIIEHLCSSGGLYSLDRMWTAKSGGGPPSPRPSPATPNATIIFYPRNGHLLENGPLESIFGHLKSSEVGKSERSRLSKLKKLGRPGDIRIPPPK